MKTMLQILTGLLLLCSEHILADDVYSCYEQQRSLEMIYGLSARLFYWYPKCLTGGYFRNVQCNYNGCFCAYVDTGTKIPNTIENAFAGYMRDACPWLSKTSPDACSLPPSYYPCKTTSRKFYFNKQTNECEASSLSCLGFDTLEACEESCVVQIKDRCNFKVDKGLPCDRQSQGERWYHDEKKESCRPFLYKGCGGNSNNYGSKWQCLKTCEKAQEEELIIQVEKTKYIISLPKWIVIQREFVVSSPVKLTVEEFKEIETEMTEIAIFPAAEEEEEEPSEEEEKKKLEEKLKETEKFRPKHAPKNMTRDKLCSMDKKPGPCRGFFSRWYFDKEQSKCILFIYGGCYGNENRHETATGCAAFCNAKVLPSEADRIKDMINSGGLIGGPLGGGKDDDDKEDDARSLELGNLPPTTTAETTAATEEVVLGESEVVFQFDDEETSTDDSN